MAISSKIYNMSNKNKIMTLGLLYFGVVVIIYITGGTKYSYPHLIYIPFILSAFCFQVIGGIIGAIISGFALAFIPLDTTTLEMQSIYNQSIRFIIFLNFGYVFGNLSKKVHKEYEKVRKTSFFHNIAELPNQNAFKVAIDNSIEKNEQFAIAIIFIENKFEIYNSIGHSKYDVALRKISTFFKRYEIDNKVTVFYSDNNYKFIFKNFSEKNTQNWIEKVSNEIIDYPININSFSMFLKAKIGAIVYEPNIQNSDELIKKAFIAVDFSINNYKDYHIYNDNMEKIFNFTNLIPDFKKSLKNRDFYIEYQPKFNLKENKFLAVEALIRWNHPTLGFIPPLNFIPQLEKTNYINDLTDWILRTGIEDIKEWKKQGIDIKVSINLTPKNIQDKKFVRKMLLILSINMPFSQNIEFELTETDLMTNLEVIKDTLFMFKKQGIKIAIDDFGTGYSSLAYLKKLPVDYIKIDRTFIKEILHDNYDREIVNTTIKLSHAMGKLVIAEGVEDLETVDLLGEMDCDEIQGYYYAKPMKKEKLIKFLL